MSSVKIKNITCHKVVNSRGDWTLRTKVQLSDGSEGIQTIPDGASKGENEAICLPVEKAVTVVSTALNDALEGEDPFDQEAIDEMMLKMDGTHNKSHLGGNSILSVSLAVANAAAASKKIPLYEYLHELYHGVSFKKNHIHFPTPIFNILNGGKHAHNGLSFQEFMVIPAKGTPFDRSMELGVNVYKDLKASLIENEMDTAVGDEGGFAPDGLTVDKSLSFIRNAINKRYKIGEDAFLGMDVAAESFHENGRYNIKEEELMLTSEELSEYYAKLLKKYELIYVEDGFYENDHDGWHAFFKKHSKHLMVVADDLVVTNYRILKKAIEKDLANAVIVKPNQVGTLSETFKFVKEARKAGMEVIVSHRSGETGEDTFIADLSLAVQADFIKSGAPVRGERVVKYNRLLDIFEELKRK
jgi:enolase